VGECMCVLRYSQGDRDPYSGLQGAPMVFCAMAVVIQLARVEMKWEFELHYSGILKSLKGF
jgi:hypothetical protein